MNFVFAFPEIPFFSEKNRASEWSLSGKTLVALLDVETYASAGLALAIAFDFTEVVDNLSSDSGFFARRVPSGGLLRGGLGARRFRFRRGKADHVMRGGREGGLEWPRGFIDLNRWCLGWKEGFPFFPFLHSGLETMGFFCFKIWW